MYTYNKVKLKFDEYKKTCPNLRINEYTTYSTRHTNFIKSLPEDEQIKYGEVFTSNDELKLYKLASDEKIMFLYAENYKSKKRDVKSDGGYTLVNLRNCKSKYVVGTLDKIDRFKNKPRNVKNGLFQHSGYSYVYQIDFSSVGYERLKFHRLNIENMKAPLVCSFKRK